MSKPLFRGGCSLIVTPFRRNGDLELSRLPAHIDWIIQAGYLRPNEGNRNGSYAN